MKSPPHRLIHASAGTGKTYQLSGRFLELLFQDVEPQRILATTFTRKAAGEIQDRVLRRLAEAALDGEVRAELTRKIGRPISAEEARARLARLTRSLHRLRVRTLDAFFVHLAQLFALELGLPVDWSIVEEAEDEALRRAAAAGALEHAPLPELVEILRGLQQADASRRVEEVLLDKVKEARDAFLESHPQAWRRVEPPPGITDEELARALAAIEALEPPRTREGTPSKLWEKELPQLVGRVRRGAWKELVGKGLGEKVVQGEDSYCGYEIPTVAREAIGTLLRQAAHELVGQVAALNRAALAWLERFERSYEELKGLRRAYRFEDLPKALHPRQENRLADREQLWYRLDGRIDHLLLDEFQDTAPVQWRILERIAQEILADGSGARSFFCVGDLKQSIYGWREAEPRLLAGLHRRYPVLEPEPLSVSYRSSSVILDTLQSVFGHIGENAAFEGRPERRSAAQEWAAQFDRHRADRELPGAACLLDVPGTGDEAKLAALELAAARARAIADEAPEATVGILLRRNEWIARTIYLLRERGLRASGEGGNALTDSTAVLHFLSLLSLADHPGDGAAAFHVATSPLAPQVGFTPEGFREQRAEVARVVRRRIALEGLGAFCASFLDLVEQRYGPWDRRRFRQLVDLAHAFEDRATLRADLFVDHVRITRVEDPSATQVQVLTIHAAKGLEFDAVILPELDVPFSPRDSALLTARPDPSGLLETVSHSVSENTCRLDSVLLGLWEERAGRELREALCLLYVAMTRARYRLDMIVQRREPARVSHDFAGILRSALGRGPAGKDGVLWAHPGNAARWFVPPEGAQPPAKAAPKAGPLFVPAAAPRALPARAPSAAEGGGLVRAAGCLRARSPERLSGQLVHRWLREVEWLEGFRAGDAQLSELARELTHDGALIERALGELRGLLARPGTRAELARPAGEVELWRERPFSVVLERDGEPALWSGSFDRVVLHGPHGRWTRAVLLDFKTDALAREELGARVEFYRPQLEGYRAVLAHLTGLDPQAIEARLLFLRLDETRIL